MVSFFGFLGLLIHRYNLFKLLVSYEITSIGLNIFLIVAAVTMNDINMLAVTVLLFAVGAAETAIGISLLLITSCNKKNDSHFVRAFAISLINNIRF